MGIPSNAADRFTSQYADGPKAGLLDWPAIRAAVVTPIDSTDLTFVTRSLYVGGAGTVIVDLAESSTVISFVGVPAGTFLPLRVKRVRSTGTTATNIVALD